VLPVGYKMCGVMRFFLNRRGISTEQYAQEISENSEIDAAPSNLVYTATYDGVPSIYV
jgi:hypothetical protein